ncbi:MAG: hypothetical protein ACR2OX_02835, partial [Methyloligellaceae bacterium]
MRAGYPTYADAKAAFNDSARASGHIAITASKDAITAPRARLGANIPMDALFSRCIFIAPLNEKLFPQSILPQNAL